MTSILRTTLLATALLAVTVLSGCNSGGTSISSFELRRNWTPELDSTTASFEEYYNARTIRRDNLKRQILDDWANIWLEGRNLRLTPYVLP